MKREEILALCASNSEAIAAYIESLESQIKDLTERLVLLESRLNQNSRNSSNLLLTIFPKENLIPRVCVKRVVRNLEVKKVIQEQLLKWLIILNR